MIKLHSAVATNISGILRNPDRTRTRTRTCTKPGLEKNPDSTLGLTFEKSRTCLHKTRIRLIKKLNSKLDSLKSVVLKALPESDDRIE